jgi:hypothetical protein
MVIGVLVITALLVGTALGVLATVVVGIHREEHRSTLKTGTRDSICLGTRRVTGLHVFDRITQGRSANAPH